MSIVEQYIQGQFKNSKTQEIGIGGFTTFARVRERYTKRSTIPTTYLEDGTHVNDHIIREPLTLIIDGNVSETYVKLSPFIEAVDEFQQAIGIIEQYTPERTEPQQSIISSLSSSVVNEIAKVDSLIQSGQQLAGFVGLVDSAVNNNVERFIDDMESNFDGDHLISIDMENRRYKNMRITNLEIERDNEQNAISFRLEAQQMRFVESVFVIVEGAPAPSEGLNGQTKSVEDKGTQEGEEVSESFLNYLSDNIGSWFF